LASTGFDAGKRLVPCEQKGSICVVNFFLKCLFLAMSRSGRITIVGKMKVRFVDGKSAA
jgi:hypothetical protein